MAVAVGDGAAVAVEVEVTVGAIVGEGEGLSTGTSGEGVDSFCRAQEGSILNEMDAITIYRRSVFDFLIILTL